MRRCLWLLSALLWLGCGPQGLYTDDPDGGVACDPACGAGTLCYQGRCIADVPCQDDNDCQDDRYCHQGHCLPYGAQPRGDNNRDCTRAVSPGLLAPKIACEWSGPAAGDGFPNHRQVLSTPLVMDFDFDNHRNPEAVTQRPSIVLVTYDGTDGACGLGPTGKGENFGVIRVLDGRTCKQQQLIQTPVNGALTPALGDLDGDAHAEIVTGSAEGGLVAFRFDRALGRFVTLWTSRRADGAASNPFAGLCEWTGPSLADLDDDGRPEVLMEGVVYNARGQLLDGALGALNAPQGVGQFAVVADVDQDGVPNLVAARGLWRWDRAKAAWALQQAFPGHSTGYVAVADFGVAQGGQLDRSRLDGKAEIAVVEAGKVFLLDLAGTVLLGPLALPGSKGGGPPTIGDFDHDGRPELAAAGSNSYTVFDPDCVMGAAAAVCPTGRADRVLWSSVSQDLSSNVTGSSLFDFEGDGSAEAIYGDECFVRILEGRSGEVLFSQQRSSCTWNEYSIVADVQGSFRSQLLVPSNMSCDISCPPVDPSFKGLRCQRAMDCPNGLGCDMGYCRCTADAQCNTDQVGGGFACRPPPAGVPGSGNTCRAAHSGKRAGLRVFSDVLNRWVSSRALWNQHAYAVTHIEATGEVPRTSQERRNWEQPGLNNFRMNIQGTASPQAAPDLTVRSLDSCRVVMGSAILSATLCNRGLAPVGDGLPVTFYKGKEVLCTGRSLVGLLPGRCAPVSCPWPGGSEGLHDISVTADDGGAGQGSNDECVEGNNRTGGTLRCERAVD